MWREEWPIRSCELHPRSKNSTQIYRFDHHCLYTNYYHSQYNKLHHTGTEAWSPYNKLRTRYRGLITHLYMNYHHFHSVMQLQTPSSSSNDHPWEENANAVCAFSGQTKICSDTKWFGLGKSNKTLETMIQKSEKLDSLLIRLTTCLQ